LSDATFDVNQHSVLLVAYAHDAEKFDKLVPDYESLVARVRVPHLTSVAFTPPLCAPAASDSGIRRRHAGRQRPPPIPVPPANAMPAVAQKR
jgi:hypothetical protein